MRTMRYIIAGFKDRGNYIPRSMRMPAAKSQREKRKLSPTARGTKFNLT